MLHLPYEMVTHIGQWLSLEQWSQLAATCRHLAAASIGQRQQLLCQLRKGARPRALLVQLLREERYDTFAQLAQELGSEATTQALTAAHFRPLRSVAQLRALLDTTQPQYGVWANSMRCALVSVARHAHRGTVPWCQVVDVYHRAMHCGLQPQVPHWAPALVELDAQVNCPWLSVFRSVGYVPTVLPAPRQRRAYLAVLRSQSWWCLSREERLLLAYCQWFQQCPRCYLCQPPPQTPQEQPAAVLRWYQAHVLV